MSSTAISTSDAATGQKVLDLMIVLIFLIVLIYGRGRH